MDEDMGFDQEAQQQHQQGRWPQQQPQPSPAAAAQFSNLHIPQQLQNQEQLLLSPSPPPVQQLFSQQHSQHTQLSSQPQGLFSPQSRGQQLHRPTCVQQQLFAPSPSQRRPQQLFFPGQSLQQQHPQQQLQPHQQLQQQAMWGNPMSPAGAPRPPAMQGSTTPARLFR